NLGRCEPDGRIDWKPRPACCRPASLGRRLQVAGLRRGRIGGLRSMVTVATSTPVIGMRPLDDAEFDRWVRLLEARTGVIVPPERKPFLETGLRRRMRETGHTRFDAYYDELLAGAKGAMEWASLVDHLTVHETHFFRHPPSLDLIRD